MLENLKQYPDLPLIIISITRGLDVYTTVTSIRKRSVNNMNDKTITTETYHVTDSGTKWPNCLLCGSEETTIIPKTEEWTCGDCGHQWHSDETIIDVGDSATIGDDIESLLRMLAKKSPKSVEKIAQERDLDIRNESDSNE